jgi:hypothetical protein
MTPRIDGFRLSVHYEPMEGILDIWLSKLLIVQTLGVSLVLCKDQFRMNVLWFGSSSGGRGELQKSSSEFIMLKGHSLAGSLGICLSILDNAGQDLPLTEQSSAPPS